MFYHAIWDPWLIVGQLIVLLCSFYLLQGAWLCLFALAFGVPLRLESLLLPSRLAMSVSSGWPALGATLLAGPMLGYLLLPVVGRAKQCLDFAASVTVLHAFLCCVYSGSLWPWSSHSSSGADEGGSSSGRGGGWEWWAANVASCAVAVVLGEYLCLQRELEAIPLSQEEREARERRALNQAQINASHSISNSAPGGSPRALASGDGGGGGVAEMTTLIRPGPGTMQERTGLLSSSPSSSSSAAANDGVTTTTIRLAPSNIFNV
jgi:hypothetical protein